MNKEVAYNNGRFKILTDTGYSDFIGVLKTTEEKQMIENVFSSGMSVKTTPEHNYYTEDLSLIRADEITEETRIYGSIGSFVERNQYTTNVVYDILHVHQNNRHYVIEKDNVCLLQQCLYLDELAFLPNAEEFYESVYPTITSGKDTKVIITSTPKGLNYFYKMWMDAENGRSDYVAYDVKWYENPTRDQNWYDTQCKNMNSKSIEQELNCVGGSTMINIDGVDYKIADVYDRYSIKNNTKNSVSYINDISITLN